MEVRPGYKLTEAGLIPLAWEVKPVGAVLSIRHGKTQHAVEMVDGPFPILATGGQIGTASKPLWDKPSVLIGRKGTINKPQYMDTPFWTVDTLFYSELKGRNSARFFFYLFCTIDWMQFNEASGVPSLNARTIESINIGVPDPIEQLVIADALKDIDALLDSQDRLITKKRDLKQAAMQQLLTGQTRLPGFSGEWNQCQVQDVVAGFFCGPSPTCEERNIQDDEWGVLKTTATTKEKGWDWTKHKTLPRIFWNKPHLELQKGDVIVTKAGPRHRVGVASWVDYVPPRIIVSGKMIGLRPRPDRVVALMLSAAISSHETQTYLDQRTTGMAESQVNFENSVLLEAPILLPHIEEQKEIAQALNEMDAELTALVQRRAKTLTLKQGMMQELLTGRKRLV